MGLRSGAVLLGARVDRDAVEPRDALGSQEGVRS